MSFNNEVEFSLYARQSRTHSEQTIPISKDVYGLKTGIIYGSNASGKSNLVKAIDCARSIITKGANNSDIFNKHFRLEKGKSNMPSKFDFEIKINDSIYNYGFAINIGETKIVEEWLYEISKTNEKPIFERSLREDGASILNIKAKLEKEEKARLDLIGKNLPPHLLFIAQVESNFIRDIKSAAPIFQIYDWFTKKLVIIKPNQKFGGIDFIGEDTDLAKTFCEFIKVFNLGIEGVESIKLDFEKTLSHFSEKIKESLLKDIKNNKRTILKVDDERYSIIKRENGETQIVRLKTKHKIKNSRSFELFETKEESDGTQRIFDFIPALINLTNEDVVYIIDEIDRSLHPILTKNILLMFLKNSQNISSQLIFTTHESSLLDLKVIRRDSIWFVEKNDFGESDLYSLDEFKPRPDKLVNKDYLLGRYGAIPFVGNIEDLDWLKAPVI